jgi:hypothetical protein
MPTLFLGNFGTETMVPNAPVLIKQYGRFITAAARILCG